MTYYSSFSNTLISLVLFFSEMKIYINSPQYIYFVLTEEKKVKKKLNSINKQNDTMGMIV